jgi:hypothetical protein
MDPELLSLASAAGTTVVQLLTTDLWERLKIMLGPLWRRSGPGQEEVLEVQLAASHAAVAGVGDDAEQVTAELTAEWQGRLRRLLAADPGLAAELRRILHEELSPALCAAGQSSPQVHMKAVVSDHGRAYQAGRDMNISER